MKHEHLYNAVYIHYLAKKREAHAMLDMIFNDSVIVGDHSSLLEEAKKWTNELSSADGCIKTLDTYYTEDEESEESEEYEELEEYEEEVYEAEPEEE